MANMEKQASAYQELAGLFNQLSEGVEIPSPEVKVGDLVTQLMKLKEESSTMEKLEGDSGVDALQNNQAYSEAVAAYFKAQTNLTQSGKMSAEIHAALQGFHKAPEPQAGEGRN
ncbi:hypothetical protein N9A86_01765 [Akkermansiaceae bacterium]|nr:hypothetical protein [Akkermansiaceae bacterium]